MSRICFVIMPFAPSFDGIWEHVIRPLVSEFGDTCHRADDSLAPGAVINDIVNSIKSADYLIADLSSKSANVFYELGMAHALGKKVILLSQDLATIPFDLRHQRVIQYSNSIVGADELRKTLAKTIHALPPG